MSVEGLLLRLSYLSQLVRSVPSASALLALMRDIGPSAHDLRAAPKIERQLRHGQVPAN
jgi:hypothetical protein